MVTPVRGSGIQPLVRCIRDGCGHLVLTHNPRCGAVACPCARPLTAERRKEPTR